MSALYNLDLLGEVPKFYFNKEERHRTLIGTIMTFICFFSCIFITLESYFDIFKVKNMSVIYNKNTNKSPFVNMTSHPFLLSLTDNYGNQIKDIERVIRIFAVFIKSDATKIYMKNMTLEKCKEEH